MIQSVRSSLSGFAWVGLALLLACSGCATTETPTASTSSQSSEVSPAKDQNPKFVRDEIPAPYPVCSTTPSIAPYHAPPDEIDLCGEPVPLQSEEVWERFDKEFTLIVYNHAQVYLWLKRMERYFPWIEERLRHYNLPDDLKYVAIVESDLQPNVCSPKGAAGPWQFMPSTGAAYGLDQQGSCDKRYDFERATDGAFRLLQDLYKRYDNWALAIAAYNCGDKRLLDEMRSQKINDYYHLKLPLETERYVFRILAIKAVLGNPAQYGYNLPKGQGYAQLRTDRVTLNLTSAVPMQTLASAAGTTFRELKRLNPTFRADDVPPGTHELKLPAGAKKTFERNFDIARTEAPPSVSRSVEPEPKPAAAQKPEPPKAPQAASMAAKPPERLTKAPEQKPEPLKIQSKAPPAPSFHTVKKGDTLSGVARQYNVSVQELRQANGIKEKDVVTPGQKLRIP